MRQSKIEATDFCQLIPELGTIQGPWPNGPKLSCGWTRAKVPGCLKALRLGQPGTPLLKMGTGRRCAQESGRSPSGAIRDDYVSILWFLRGSAWCELLRGLAPCPFQTQRHHSSKMKTCWWRKKGPHPWWTDERPTSICSLLPTACISLKSSESKKLAACS